MRQDTPELGWIMVGIVSICMLALASGLFPILGLILDWFWMCVFLAGMLILLVRWLRDQYLDYQALHGPLPPEEDKE